MSELIVVDDAWMLPGDLIRPKINWKVRCWPEIRKDDDNGNYAMTGKFVEISGDDVCLVMGVFGSDGHALLVLSTRLNKVMWSWRRNFVTLQRVHRQDPMSVQLLASRRDTVVAELRARKQAGLPLP